MGERINKTIFVVGGTDFVGSSFLPELLKQLGDNAKVFLLTAIANEPIDPRVVNLIGGLKDIEQFTEQLKISSFVYYLPIETSLETETEQQVSIIDPTKKMIDFLRGSSVLESFVLVSSVRVSSELITANDKSAFACEEYLRQAGVSYTIMRTGLIYGRFLPARSPLTTLVAKIYKWEFVVRGKYSKEVSLIHVEDLVHALLVCLENKKLINKIYNAEAESLTLGEIIATLREHMKGEKPRQLPLPAVLLGSLYNELPPATHDNIFLAEVFENGQVRRFEDRAIDCITTHISNVGYWVITGANSGIGLELACRLHAGGKNLILVDKERSNLVGLGKQRIIIADLSDRQQVLEVLEKMAQYRIYVLINNAGVGYRADFIDNHLEQIERTVAVNVSAPLLLTKKLLPEIIKNNGVIVNIASSAAYNPLPGMSIYAASKSFILNWSVSLWHELRGKCLVVTCSPSGTNTKFQEQAGVKNTAALLPPRWVAHKIVTAIANRHPFLFIGKKNQLFIYLSRFLPTRLNVMLWGYLFKKLR